MESGTGVEHGRPGNADAIVAAAWLHDIGYSRNLEIARIGVGRIGSRRGWRVGGHGAGSDRGVKTLLLLDSPCPPSHLG